MHTCVEHISYASSVVIKYNDQKHLREELVWLKSLEK